MKEFFKFKFDARTKLLVCIWVIVVGSVIYYRSMYMPKAGYLGNVKDRYAALADELERLESQIPHIKAEKKKLESMKAEYDKMFLALTETEKKLPNNTDIPDILRFLVKKNDDYNVKIVNIKARNDKLEEVPLYTPHSQQGVKQKAVSYYSILPIEIQMYASYDSVIAYIGRIEKELPYQRVGSLAINMQKTFKGNPECMITVLNLLGRGQEEDVAFEEFQEAISRADKAEDPFHKSERPRLEQQTAGMELKGIIWKKGVPYAIINDASYTTDDIVQGKRVVKIEKDSVLLEQEEKLYRLKIKGR